NGTSLTLTSVTGVRFSYQCAESCRIATSNSSSVSPGGTLPVMSRTAVSAAAIRDWISWSSSAWSTWAYSLNRSSSTIGSRRRLDQLAHRVRPRGLAVEHRAAEEQERILGQVKVRGDRHVLRHVANDRGQ